MSFETLKVSELKAVAEEFGVETEGLKNKSDIIAALAEEGITWTLYQDTVKKIEEESVPVEEEVLPRFDATKEISKDQVLVRMTRANFRYDIMGKTFTKDHPFVAMSQDDAQKIFDKEEGFRLATPAEVKEFYN
jgi:hypothetical protein